MSTSTPLLAALLAAGPALAPGLTYPETRQVDQVDVYHGVAVADPYRWLEDTDSPATREWIEAQNRLSSAYLADLPEREEVEARLTRLWDYPRHGEPVPRGGRYFFLLNDGLQSQSVLYWQTALDAAPRVLVDPNPMSPDGTVALSGFAPSDDGKLLAYSLSEAGSDWQTIWVREVDTGRDRDDVLRWVKFSELAWTRDGRGFFYGRYPEPPAGGPALRLANAHQRVYYHVVGQPQTADRLIWERPDQPEWRARATVSDDGRFLVISIQRAGPRNRVAYVDLRRPRRPDLSSPPVMLIDDFDSSWDFLGNDRRTFYFKTDLAAPRGRVVALDLDPARRSRLRTVVAEAEDAIQSVSLLGKRLLVHYLHDAHSRLRWLDLGGRAAGEIELPGLGSVTGLGGRRRARETFYTYTSYLEPPTVYRHDLRRRRTAVLHRPEVDFDPSPYETRQLWFSSKDGTRVPMFVTARKGLRLDGSSPTWLTGYGGFRASTTPRFSVPTLVWLERGGIHVAACLRGGGEFGAGWHLAGTREHKQNVFDDFIAAAEHLVAAGYTSPARLAIAGGSNGGLLIGAVLNQRPDLFAAALPAVGVMDMLRYHRFTIGSAWELDYGTSDDERLFPALRAYSPLHNIQPGTRYPATLITTGDHDDRVVPGHSFKYAAALQPAQASTAPILIRVETRAGHGAGKPTAIAIAEAADRLAFALHQTAAAR